MVVRARLGAGQCVSRLATHAQLKEDGAVCTLVGDAIPAS